MILSGASIAISSAACCLRLRLEAAGLKQARLRLLREASLIASPRAARSRCWRCTPSNPSTNWYSPAAAAAMTFAASCSSSAYPTPADIPPRSARARSCGGAGLWNRDRKAAPPFAARSFLYRQNTRSASCRVGDESFALALVARRGSFPFVTACCTRVVLLFFFWSTAPSLVPPFPFLAFAIVSSPSDTRSLSSLVPLFTLRGPALGLVVVASALARVARFPPITKPAAARSLLFPFPDASPPKTEPSPLSEPFSLASRSVSSRDGADPGDDPNPSTETLALTARANPPGPCSIEPLGVSGGVYDRSERKLCSLLLDLTAPRVVVVESGSTASHVSACMARPFDSTWSSSSTKSRSVLGSHAKPCFTAASASATEAPP